MTTMIPKIRFLVPVLLLAAAGCASAGRGSGAAVRAPVGAEFGIRPGQTADIDNGALRLTFTRVADDSRCPRDVQCVRAGEAKVELAARAPGSEARTLVLQTPTEPRSAAYAGYTVELLRLEPQPSSAEPRPRYLAFVIVRRP